MHGLDVVDEIYRDLIVDLQRVEFATSYRQANITIPLWVPMARRLAISLARCAIEAHEAATTKTEALREDLRQMSGVALVERALDTYTRLQNLIDWVPRERRRHLWWRPPWFQPDAPPIDIGEFLEQLEIPYIAYVTASVSRGEADEVRVREYVRLAHETDALELEHRRRWRDELLPGLGALVLALDQQWSENDKAMALNALEAHLALDKVRRGRFGGNAPDRSDDFPQDLRLHLIALIRARLGNSPATELLARLYEADISLTHIPNAAMDDFRNERAKVRRREKIAPVTHAEELMGEGEGNEDDGGRSEDDVIAKHAAAEGHPMRTTPFAAPDNEAASRSVRELYEAKTLQLFRHTRTERRILRSLLSREDIDPRDTGFVDALAAAADCARETVSRYLAKVRKDSRSRDFLV